MTGGDPSAPAERLARYYEKHHRSNRSPGLVVDPGPRTQFFGAYIGVGNRLLDLGCRDGALVKPFLAGNDVVGLDIDREALKRAAQLGITPVWGDVDDRLPFEDGSFDVVLAGELLPHVRYPGNVVAEARRVLCPGGAFIGSTPNAYRLKARLEVAVGRDLLHDTTQLHAFSITRLKDMLQEHFGAVELRCVASRFLRASPRLFGNTVVFAAR
jgi:SAM-dependent methyltransferase